MPAAMMESFGCQAERFALYSMGSGSLVRQLNSVEKIFRNSQGLTALAFSLSKDVFPGHRKHTKVSGRRWMTMHLSSRLELSGQEGNQHTDSADSVEA